MKGRKRKYVNLNTVNVEFPDAARKNPTLNREAIFEQVFKTFFKDLHSYAFTIVNDDVIAEETVQQVFFKLWTQNESIQINSSIKAYLYKCVYHESLNLLKHQKVRTMHKSHVLHHAPQSTDDGHKTIMMKEMEEHLRKALNELPEQCRTIFQMSRFGELKYQQIADSLGLSVKTIENQMGKALKILRIKMADYLPTLIIILMTI